MEKDFEKLEVINLKKASLLRRISFISCLVVVFLSITTLLGWQLNNDLLKSTIPGQNFTSQPVALSLIFLSSAVLILLKVRIKLRNIFSLVLLCSTLILNFMYANYYVTPPNTLSNIFLISFSILFLLFNRKYFTHVAQLLALVAAAVSMFAVLGYVYQVLVFYKFSSFPPMALNTALAFSFISISILFAKPDHGFMRILIINTNSSKLAFRLIVALLTIPPIMGFLTLFGQFMGIYDSNMAIAMLVVSNLIIFTVIVWLNTYSLQSLELEQIIIKQELKSKNIKLEMNAKELSNKLIHLEGEKQETIDNLISRGIFSK